MPANPKSKIAIQNPQSSHLSTFHQQSTTVRAPCDVRNLGALVVLLTHH
jgi:hypothetical protein